MGTTNPYSLVHSMIGFKLLIMNGHMLIMKTEENPNINPHLKENNTASPPPSRTLNLVVITVGVYKVELRRSGHLHDRVVNSELSRSQGPDHDTPWA